MYSDAIDYLNRMEALLAEQAMELEKLLHEDSVCWARSYIEDKQRHFQKQQARHRGWKPTKRHARPGTVKTPRESRGKFLILQEAAL